MKFNNIVTAKSGGIFLLYTLIVLPLLISACKSDASGPQEPVYGLTGRVTDTAGVSLDSVKIFCYYNYYPGYPYSPQRRIYFKPANTDTFGFTLYQNYPNPVNNSTYIKFALSMDSHIDLSITRRNSNSDSYQYASDCLAGLYQFYLYNLVDSLKLKNGMYDINLSARNDKGVQYNAKKSMFVLSTLGSPNAATNKNGEYYFDYNEAFIGDSIAIRQTQDYDSFTEMIYGNISFILMRRGYKTQYFNITLYPQVLIRHDLVMLKENK